MLEMCFGGLYVYFWDPIDVVRIKENEQKENQWEIWALP